MTNIFDEKVGKNLKVIKHNTLVEAQYELSPVPNNLMTLAVVKVRNGEMGLPNYERTGEVVITADEYAKIHGIDIRTAYKDLKHAVLELKNASLCCDAYYDFNATKGMSVDEKTDYMINSDRYRSNVIIGTKPKHKNYAKMKLHIKLVDRVGYSEEGAFVYFRFSDDVMYLIENSGLDYTSYPYANTVEMNITPMKRMYELACKWVKIGECKKNVDDWRHFFGLANKYPNIAEFKRRVIEPAIKGVNKQGDFLLTLDQQKLGKTITHLIIKIKDKRNKELPKKLENRDPDTVDILHGLTDKEFVIIRQKVADYITHLESKGELVNDFYRKNIENKAIAERWGLDEYYEQIQKAENERQTKQAQYEQEQRAERERQAMIAKERADDLAFVQYFESLPIDEQGQILDEVANLVTPPFVDIFAQNRAEYTAHKNPMIRHIFKQVMGV